MTSRPILMSGPMVRAILDGRKTQTRRVVKPQPDWEHPMPCSSETPEGWQGPLDYSLWAHEGDPSDCARRCPYGAPGDTLWVREAFSIVPRTAYAMSDGVQQTLRPDDNHDAAIYHEGWERSRGGIRWHPSIHMPRWASRITLEITGVRVERLQDISSVDALAEGIDRPTAATIGAKLAYKALWTDIYGPGSWDRNDWVWVVEFRKLPTG